MAIKIIQLPAEDSPTGDDLVIIRDNLTGTTRKIPLTIFFANPPIGDNAITGSMIADGSISKSKLGADAKIGPRLNTQSSPSTLTPDIDNYDIFAVTNLNTNMTIAAPTGTPIDGQGMMFRIKDNGTARTITWNAIYRAVGVTMPTSTTSGKMLYATARYNAPALKYDILAIGREA